MRRLNDPVLPTGFDEPTESESSSSDQAVKIAQNKSDDSDGRLKDDIELHLQYEESDQFIDFLDLFAGLISSKESK